LKPAETIRGILILHWAALKRLYSLEKAHANSRSIRLRQRFASKSFRALYGLYCFKLNFLPTNVVATLADDPTASNQGGGFIKAELRPTPLFTCANVSSPDAVVETGTETSLNGGQSAGGYAFYVHWTK
jgi:hypothetical protein